MSAPISIAHDFICPWCWVAWLQTERLQKEFNVAFDWRGYELFPEELEWPDPAPAPEPPQNKPPVLSRFEFLLVADGIEMPKGVERPPKMRTHAAHEAVAYAKTEGVQDALIEALYRAYWERGEKIGDTEVVLRLAHGIVKDVDALAEAIATRRFAGEIVGFDDDAHATGVYNVPTFYIGGEVLAERPYVHLREATARWFGR